MFKRILLFACVFFISNLAMAKTYVFGVVPQQSPLVLHKKWTPVVKYLSKKTGLNISFKTEKSIGDFEKALYAGKYDLAYMNPYHYVVASRTQGFDAALRRNKQIRGILLTQKNKSIEDLSGSSIIAFPSPNAFAATLVMKYELIKDFGIDLQKSGNYKYVNSHDSVYKGVARGIADFGGGVQRTFKNFNSKADKDKLHVVHTTAAYPSHPIAFIKGFDVEDRKKVVQAFLTMPKYLLKALSMKKIIETNDQEFEVIRKIESALQTE